MASRIVGATIGQLFAAPFRVAEAAMGIKGTKRGLTPRGGTGGRVPIISRNKKTLGKAVRSRMVSMHSHIGNARSGKSVAKAGKMGGRTGPVKVKQYTKHTKSGRVIQVRGYQRPFKKR